MIATIRDRTRERGITRLCHFTPSRNLGHIATDRTGVLSARRLEADERRVFNPTDWQRLDGFTDHICCSIQYPNAWYFRKARQAERLFRDWVVLLIDPRYLWSSGTKFCARNAAAKGGEYVAEGVTAFESLFAGEVRGAKGNTYRRSSAHPPWLPTDEQAEVLIPDLVDRSNLMGVAVADEGQGRLEVARLEQLGVEAFPIYVAREFFDPYTLSTNLRAGEMPEEVLLKGGKA